MKNYEQFEKVFIGSSDIASLAVRSCRWVGLVYFGKDGDYSAYICDGDVEIPPHYEKVFSGMEWLHLYDDQGLSYKCVGHNKCVDIYRAGEMGCIIHWHEPEEDIKTALLQGDVIKAFDTFDERYHTKV